jgi:hypothetical protein
MNHVTAELDQTDEDILNEVSDETLEAAAGTYIGGQFMVTIEPTIMVGGMLLTWRAKPYNPAKESNAGPTKKAPQRAAHRQTRRQQTCRPRILGRDFFSPRRKCLM